MPVTGRPPKDAGARVTRHPLQHDWTDVEDVPFEGRKLPARMPNGGAWSAAVKRWWKVISAMPHCVLWDDSDWMFAEETAWVAEKFFTGDMTVRAEVREREKVMGMTIDARRGLRIRYVAPGGQTTDEAPPPEIAQLQERRARLMEVSS